MGNPAFHLGPRVSKNPERDAEICRLSSKGISNQKLAQQFGLDSSRIKQIVTEYEPPRVVETVTRKCLRCRYDIVVERKFFMCEDCRYAAAGEWV